MAEGPPWWSGRVAFDSGIYLAIAEDGYVAGRAHEAAFPGYGLLIRAVSSATGLSVVDAAVAISLLSGLAAVQLCWRWLHDVGVTGRSAVLALTLTAWYPPAFVIYGVAYSDGLLLALVVGALLAVQRDRWVLAGVLGAAATFTRPNSLALVPAMVVWALHRSGAWELGPAGGRWSSRIGRLRFGRLRPAHLAVALVPVGVVAYGTWLVGHAGSFTYFADLQTDVYGHSPVWHPYSWLKFPVWKDPIQTWGDVVHETAALAVHLGVAASLPRIARRLDLGCAVLVGGVLAISWVGNYGFAPGRYLLPAVPVVAASWAPSLAMQPRWVGAGVALASGAAMVAMAAGFAGAFDLNW